MECSSFPDEEFRQIRKHPAYWIGSRGTVYRQWPHKRKVLRPATKNGYKFVLVSTDGKPYKLMVHQLVCKHFFIGPYPSTFEICHNDGNRTNNFRENLRPGTRESNKLDAREHGKQGKISSETAAEIACLLDCGEDVSVLAALFCTSISTVNAIQYGSAWSWATGRKPGRRTRPHLLRSAVQGGGGA